VTGRRLLAIFEDVLSNGYSRRAGAARAAVRARCQCLTIRSRRSFAEPAGRDVACCGHHIARGSRPRGHQAACILPYRQGGDARSQGRVLVEGKQISSQRSGVARARAASAGRLITIKIAPHPFFKLDGAPNLGATCRSRLYEAVLGRTQVRVPTLGRRGRSQRSRRHQQRPHLSASRARHVVEGKTGDLYATVRIRAAGEGRHTSTN